jgi:hypothetical protein
MNSTFGKADEPRFQAVANVGRIGGTHAKVGSILKTRGAEDSLIFLCSWERSCNAAIDGRP